MTQDKPQKAFIQMSGGVINAQAFAVGDSAQATVNNGGFQDEAKAEVLARLQAVLDALEKHGGDLPDSKTAIALTERISNEVAKKEPDALTLKSFLGSLADQVKSVATIATAVTALGTLVGSLI